MAITNIEVSRFFEPVPKLAVEARYKFHWNSDGFQHANLSMRRHKIDRINSQFDKREEIPLRLVPDDVVEEAREMLSEYREELATAKHTSDNTIAGEDSE